MKITSTIKKLVFFALTLIIISLTASAQKQPQIQEGSVRAPENVKIDGKIKEWASPFQNARNNDNYLSAYNSSSRVYYTVANDDDNLYFVIRGLGSGVAQKELSGGLTITVSHATDRKKEKAPDNVSVTFPVPQSIKVTQTIMGQLATVGGYVDEDTTANRKQIDSISAVTNKMINNYMKEIRVIGVKEVPDSVLSVYNTLGIKVAIQYIKRQPIVEIAVPLKYLGLSIKAPVKFSYNIKLGAIAEPNLPTVDIVGSIAPSDAMPMSTMKVGVIGGGGGGNAGFLFNPTDFWGEYTLAKK